MQKAPETSPGRFSWRLVAVLVCGGLATVPAASPAEHAATNRVQRPGAVVKVPAASGPFQLQLGLSGARDMTFPPVVYTLEACGESLLTVSAAWAAADSRPAPTELAAAADLLVDGRGFDPEFTNALAVVERLTGKDWEYAVVDAAPAYGRRLTRFRRHLLFVQPDLFVIYDDLATPAPALFEYRLRSPANLTLDARSGDLRLELPKAGLVAHWLTAASESFQPWRTVMTVAGAAPDLGPGRVFETVATNRLTEFRALTVIVPHCAGRKKGTGFKLLESDTAIGARIYRDGLPTLLAFRTVETGEANLTGLKFTSPVAVDVFRPKARRP